MVLHISAAVVLAPFPDVLLFANRVSFGEPSTKLLIQIARCSKPKRVDMITRPNPRAASLRYAQAEVGRRASRERRK